jgi:hypothetical protein
MAKLKQEDSIAVIEQYSVLTLATEELKSVIADNMGQDRLEVTDLDLVKMPSGGSLAWTLPTIEGEDAAKTFEGIIVHWKNQRSYYKDAFSGQSNPPDCFSSNGKLGIGTPGGDCEVCPLAQWGSAEKGNSQACRQNRLLFILRPESFLPLVLRLSPASIAASKQYFVRLAARNQSIYETVTEFGLVKEQSKDGIAYSKATFRPVRTLAAEETARFKAYKLAMTPILDRTTIIERD